MYIICVYQLIIHTLVTTPRNLPSLSILSFCKKKKQKIDFSFLCLTKLCSLKIIKIRKAFCRWNLMAVTRSIAIKIVMINSLVVIEVLKRKI